MPDRELPAMLPKRLKLSSTLAFFTFVSASLLIASPEASAKKPALKHIFVISHVEVPKSAPPELEAMLVKQLRKAIEAEPNLLAEIPEDAPPIDETQKGLSGNKPFRAYMKKHGMRPYKVIVQVTDYEQSVAANPRKPGNIISARVALQMFGETMPEHVMAFSGEGSAKVLIEVGKKVRAKDKEYADKDSLELAVADAIKTSMQKLQSEPPAQPRKKPSKKKK